MAAHASPAPAERAHVDVASPVAALIALVAVAATILLVVTFASAVELLRADPAKAFVFLALTLALQGFSVEVYGRGSVGVSAIAMIATAVALGPGPAIIVAVVAAAFQWVRRRGLLHRAVFDASNFALSAAAAAFVYHAIPEVGPDSARHVVATSVAGLAYAVVNCSLLIVAMSLSEGVSKRKVWSERFSWAKLHLAAFGPLAAAITLAYDRLDIVGLVAFTLPPMLLVYSVRQYLEHTRAAAEEVRQVNADLQRANDELGMRNDDLHELFAFAGGLAAVSHDGEALTAYAEEALSRLTGGAVRASLDGLPHGLPLVSAGTVVGSIVIEPTPWFDDARWRRLSDTILPQLATAFETAGLVERVRRTHRDTIAALSRSMEAKDYYTGGHTERVAEISVAIARELGFSGSDLDAIEIGALLHDIGKIGIPETILHKQASLDEAEWKVMREHPVISSYILSEIELHPAVLQIARSSHERIDGTGYPDALAGDDIPLPARIVAVADALDALTTDRPYRRARPTLAAIEEIRDGAGSHFCPRVVAALEQVYRNQPQVLGLGVLRAVGAA